MLEEVNIWCEDNFFIVTNPSNTFSNIFYVLASFYIYKKDCFFAFFTFITGLFSAFYHCFDIVLYQIYDFAGIYLVLTHIIYIYRKREHDKYFVLSNAALNSVSILTLTEDDFKFTPQCIVFILILYIYYLEPNKLNIKFILSWFFLTIAAGCSIIDISKIHCIPTSPIQFHALWHLFSSISLCLIHTRFNHLF